MHSTEHLCGLLELHSYVEFLKTSCGWGFNKGFLGKRLLLLLSWSVVLLMAGSPVPGKEPSIEQVLLMCVCVLSRFRLFATPWTVAH